MNIMKFQKILLNKSILNNKNIINILKMNSDKINNNPKNNNSEESKNKQEVNRNSTEYLEKQLNLVSEEYNELYDIMNKRRILLNKQSMESSKK